MTKVEIMDALKAMDITFDRKAKKDTLEAILNEELAKRKAMDNKRIENTAKKEDQKDRVKYTREQKMASIASVVPAEVYDYGMTIKLMSNKSVAVKQDKKRLFRLDRLGAEYQLTSDRNTLLQADERVESVWKESKKKFFYRFRTESKEDVINVMRRCVELYK